MPPRILTVQEIITRLNTAPNNVGVWTEFPMLAGLPAVKINGPANIDFLSNGAYVVKIFINSTTGEVKSFLAKSINVPGRENL